ncbi:MAG TPA: substrate-binding domain-containing protein [Mobilitalea sp.]|nr:substrate-binding domain-containing protein [Mobilitalea sp.]
MKNVTMKDIARMLDVSTVTVSKALSDKDGVSAELREKIKETAKQLGYRYNSLAKGMKEGRSYNIGIIIAERYIKDDMDAFYLKMFHNLVKSLSKVDYYGIMDIVSQRDEKELVMPNMISENKVDGVIILGQMNTDYLIMIKNTDIPLVFLDFYDDQLDVNSITSDNFYGAYTLTNYVISMGHREIGFVGNILATKSILDRYLGYYKALISNKIDYHEEWLVLDRDDSGEYIDFKLPEKMPTAFVCNCDSVAYLFIRKLKKMGYKVPDEISVVGFDNYIYATLSSPRLTTVQVDMEAMAEMATHEILSKIEGDKRVFGRKVISGNLIIRDSVKKLN